MSASHRLYDRPWLDQGGMPALYVTGALSSSVVEAAFSGRLQIHNAQGACWAELIDGELPKGYSITVDNDTSEVVVAWPAYSSGEVTLTNGDFESGAKGWNLGPGWSLTDQASAYSGQWCAQWSGSGNSQILSDWVPIIGGTTTSLSVQVQQGASSAGNVGMQCVIEFRDANKQPIEGGTVTGNMVASGSGGEWNASTLQNITVPASATEARAGGSAYRKRETKPAWLDAVQWTWNVGEQGTKTPMDSSITIRVHDAAGRYADWTGLVQIGYLILTSAPYPVESSVDKTAWAMTPGDVTIHTEIKRYTSPAEKSAWSMTPGTLTLRSITQYYTQPAEKSAWSLEPGTATITTIVKRYSQPAEKTAWAMTPGTLTISTIVIRYTNPAEKTAWVLSPGTATITTP